MNPTNTINDLLSDDLKVKPLVGEEVAEFRLIRAGFKDPMSGNLVSPAGHQLPGRTIIRDPQNGDIQIMNITGQKPIARPGQQTIYEPEFGSVMFPSTSTILCTADMNNLYFYLKRMNENRDNPYRRTRSMDGKSVIPTIFYEVDYSKQAKKTGNSFEFKRLAFNIVSDATDKERLALAFSLNERGIDNLKIDLNKKGTELKNALNTIAENYPTEIIQASDNVEAKLNIWVEDAVKGHHILYNDHPDKRLWIWKRDPGKKGKKNIVQVTLGNDPTKALIDYLQTAEGSEHKIELGQLVGKESPVEA